MKNTFSNDQIHAYIDGELSESQAREFEQQVTANPALEKEVCALLLNKQNIAHFYRQIDVPDMNFSLDAPKPLNLFQRRWSSLAASIFLGMILGAGALSSYVAYPPHLATAPMAEVSSSKFMVHLDSNEPGKFAQTLTEAQYLLKSNPNAEVEIIANYQGIQLFNASHAETSEIKAMLEKYDNLRLIACQRALEIAIKDDKSLQMLPEVKTDAPAIDEVVNKLKQGWTYIKI